MPSFDPLALSEIIPSLTEGAAFLAVVMGAGRRDADQIALPLNDRLRFLNADGSRNEAAIASAAERRIAHYRHSAHADYLAGLSADDWRHEAIATVEAEVGGELQIWNVRAGRVRPVSEATARELATDGPLNGGTGRW